MNYTDVVSAWGEQVPAAEVVKLAGLSYQDVYNLRRRGWLRTTSVQVTGVKGPPVRLMLSHEDALCLLAAAALAAATALAVATVFRTLRESGATVDPATGGVTIPVTFPQARQATAGDVMAA